MAFDTRPDNTCMAVAQVILRTCIFSLAVLTPQICPALTLDFPAVARPLAERSVAQDSYFIPLGSYQDGPIPGVIAEGAVRLRSWKIGVGGLTTLQILVPLRRQLEDAGFEMAFECEDRVCGGFDFRFQMDILPEPDMHVNLGDFRYLAAKRVTGDVTEYVCLIVSRSANAGFVQLCEVGVAQENTSLTASTKTPDASLEDVEVSRSLPSPGIALTAIGQRLETVGHATLDDLEFQTGSSQLGEREFSSLESLAAYLLANPRRQVMLVGHTDAEGSLAGNISLSRKRATAVVARLTGTLGVPARQVSADGVGFLSPRASNLTDDGRATNRRVEVILTSTQ